MTLIQACCLGSKPKNILLKIPKTENFLIIGFKLPIKYLELLLTIIKESRSSQSPEIEHFRDHPFILVLFSGFRCAAFSVLMTHYCSAVTKHFN